ncbi:hypothetical protein P9112_005988 [Eukaryota sp. TZLM1-RC]
MKLFLLVLTIAALALAEGVDPTTDMHTEPPTDEPVFDGDEYCHMLQEGSYCKHWLHVPVCQHLDVPCGGEEFCQSLEPGSYCKFWLDIPVCQGLDVPCGPHMPEMQPPVEVHDEI